MESLRTCRKRILTMEQRKAVEEALLESSLWSQIGGKLAREYGISRERISQIKRGLCSQRLFYYRQKHALLGRVSNGRFFLVDITVFDASIDELMAVDRFTYDEAEAFNLDPTNWEICIGVPGVTWDE